MFAREVLLARRDKDLRARNLVRAVAAGTARVLMSPRSVPQWDSVRHIVPDHSPATIFGR